LVSEKIDLKEQRKNAVDKRKKSEKLGERIECGGGRIPNRHRLKRAWYRDASLDEPLA